MKSAGCQSGVVQSPHFAEILKALGYLSDQAERGGIEAIRHQPQPQACRAPEIQQAGQKMIDGAVGGQHTERQRYDQTYGWFTIVCGGFREWEEMGSGLMFCIGRGWQGDTRLLQSTTPSQIADWIGYGLDPSKYQGCRSCCEACRDSVREIFQRDRSCVRVDQSRGSDITGNWLFRTRIDPKDEIEVAAGRHGPHHQC